MKKAVIVDFDLTFVTVNSFEMFYKMQVLYSLSNLMLTRFLFFLWNILLRKAKIISHSELKKRVLAYLTTKDNSQFMSSFIEKLDSCIALDVLALCEDFKSKGYSVYLCTAAPSIYILPFLNSISFNFDDVVCTPNYIKGSNWTENLNVHKKKSVENLLLQKHEYLSVLITDHRDDLPLLILQKDQNILVRPSKKTLNTMEQENVKYELI